MYHWCVSCYFINIHQPNKWVSAACVCMKYLLDLNKMETSGFTDIAALAGEK